MNQSPDTTKPVRPGEELDLAKLEPYLLEHLPGARGPLEVEQFPGGASNLTYLVRLGDRELVLRRPPFGNRVKSAHDMGREYRVLSKLHAVYAPGAEAGSCTARTRACSVRRSTAWSGATASSCGASCPRASPRSRHDGQAESRVHRQPGGLPSHRLRGGRPGRPGQAGGLRRPAGRRLEQALRRLPHGRRAGHGIAHGLVPRAHARRKSPRRWCTTTTSSTTSCSTRTT